MDIINPIYFKNRKEWQNWLKENHNKGNEVWLVYYKKHTGKLRIPYVDAVEEALCYGWIDSIVKRIDDERYCQKFTPRKKKSGWSELNKNRVKKLISEKRMTEYGMMKIDEAKRNGKWDEIFAPQKEFEMPQEFMMALSNNKRANQYFNKLSQTHKKKFINWIASAKKSETKSRRSMMAINLLEANKKLGIK